jgi:hypothetical protein
MSPFPIALSCELLIQNMENVFCCWATEVVSESLEDEPALKSRLNCFRPLIILHFKCQWPHRGSEGNSTRCKLVIGLYYEGILLSRGLMMSKAYKLEAGPSHHSP